MVSRMCIDRCGNLAAGGGSRCKACVAKRERTRGTPSQRGYGAQHQAARKALAEGLPDLCGRGLPGYCGKMIRRGEAFVAAHVVDGDPTRGWVAAHPGCNERAKVRA